MSSRAIPQRTASWVLALSGASVLGVYAGLPLGLAALARLRPRPVRSGPVRDADVTVVIAAYNEQEVIEAKLADIAAQRLDPSVNLSIVVASDGSSDRTVELAKGHAAGARVLDLARGGKAQALNSALQTVDPGIVVFTDANSRLHPDTLSTLLAPFADPEVGAVAGSQRYGTDGVDAQVGEADYWAFEDRLKQLESAVGSVVSATGTLYAIRTEFIDPVPDGVTDDFWISTGAVVRGRRLVFEPRAAAWEEPADGSAAEYRRRVRIITRGLRGVLLRRELLDVRRHGLYSIVLFVHKVARRALFVPLTTGLLAATALARTSRFWRAAAAAGWGAIAVAVAANLSDAGWARARPARALAHFGLANAAAAHGFVRVLRRQRVTMWEPER